MYIIEYLAEILYAKVNGTEYGTKSHRQRGSEIPDKIYLSQNYPNPFNSSTIIEYGIPFYSNIKIELYDILGKKVDTIVSGEHSAGKYSITLNTGKLSGGIYFYTISANNFFKVRKMVYLK
jgi:hypothetical protein